MSNAPNYTPATSFATDESNQVAGRSTVKTVSLDVEFANVSSSINALNTNIKLLQRDDGKIKDLLIEPYALSEQTRALLAASGLVRGLWVGATAYAQGDVVQYTNIAFLCITAHTSSGAFDATLWMAVSGDGSAAASAIAAAASAMLADADRVSAEAAAATAVANATTSTTQAGIATTQATTATNKAIAASTSETNAAASASAAQAAVVGNIGAAIHSTTLKPTPDEADELPLVNSVASAWDLRRYTWANIKTTLLTQLRDITGGFVGMTLFKINFKNAANTFTSFFTNANTAARTYTFQDKDGTIADLADVATKAAVAQVHYVGTTSIAANRGSGAQTLTGISIDGNCGGAAASNVLNDVGVSGLGMIAVMQNNSGSSMASSAVIAGPTHAYNGGTAVGSWRNIGAMAIGNTGLGMMQRIS